MASMMGSSMLENSALNRGARPYPLLRRHNYAQRQLLATVTITVTLTLALSLLIGGLTFIGLDEDAAAQRAKYGPPKCPAGRGMYDEPVNNFSPCCTHYSATCCPLHDGGCRRAYDFGAPSFPRTERCEALLSLLSCARCSPCVLPTV